MKKLAVGEADTLYRIYTEDYGMIRALAQGVRKEEAKLRGHLELLSRSRIRFVVGRGGEKLIAASLVRFGERLRSHETTLSLAAAVAGAVDAECFPGQRDDGVWHLLSEAFTALDREDFSEERSADFLADFHSRLQERLGYGASGKEEIV